MKRRAESPTAFVTKFPDRGPGADARTTIDRFGRQWDWFRDLDVDYVAQFKDWVQPLGPDDFRRKRVLEAGCGMGRWLEVVSSWGAERVVGVDASESIHAAKENVVNHPNASVVGADLHHLPFREDFDLVFSIGVLHHLPDPRKGFESIVRAVRKGGKVFCWVYGLEGNEWIVRYVNPIRRRITSHLSRRSLLLLSRGLAAALHPYARLLAAGGARAQRVAPYGAYLGWLGQFGFQHTEHVVYDHLNPAISHYIPRAEVEAWFGTGFKDVQITQRNRNSWRAVGTRT